MTRCELLGNITNGADNAIKVIITHDESKPGTLWWELTYEAHGGPNVVSEHVEIDSLRKVLLKGDLLVQDRLTFIVSGEKNARLYVGALFSYATHIAVSLPTKDVEEFCNNLP
jgi:hypothetical protein